MADQVRLEAYFSGHVQGVGFRFTARDVAERFPKVTGYVRNLPDGRVQLVAEGDRARVEEFLDAVSGAMRGYISSVSSNYSQATGEFNDFAIARFR